MVAEVASQKRHHVAHRYRMPTVSGLVRRRHRTECHHPDGVPRRGIDLAACEQPARQGRTLHTLAATEAGQRDTEDFGIASRGIEARRTFLDFTHDHVCPIGRAIRAHWRRPHVGWVGARVEGLASQTRCRASMSVSRRCRGRCAADAMIRGRLPAIGPRYNQLATRTPVWRCAVTSKKLPQRRPSPAAGLSRHLPELLARLNALALNVHWAWNHAGDAVWKRLDETLWERTQNPWLLLQYVPFERLERLADDAAFLRDVQALEESEERYRATPAWRPSGTTTLPRVAYFSMEFGLHEALPLYSGGLGVLAGDHLKTASDLGVPLIGIGIRWQQGYFRQVIDRDGRQSEFHPFNDPATLPIQPVAGPSGERLRISLAFADRTILLQAWQVTVGRTTLYLLDSNDPFNTPADRGLTGTLYGGSSEIRLLQEVILGVGGWRLAQALGLEIEVCHLNEGHAAFVVLERARDFMQQHGVTFREALWATRVGNIFTTHTAVPAGFDTFSTAEIERHRPCFDEYVQSLGLSWPELLALGRRNPADPHEPFNMAWLAMRGSSFVNGVSQLHGEVSRRLFAGLYPRWPERDIPVDHVTNGVHVPSWDSQWTDALWTRAAGKERWRGDVSALTAAAADLSDEALWNVRTHEREDLVGYARERLTRQLARHSSLQIAAETARQVLDPDVLTLGFARRFATYKRANLLLADPPRLLRLLTHAERPVQLIIAGKAHPQDEEGKALIQHWAQFASRPEVRRHVVFLDDYDMRLANELVEGVDVWINTPRRPWEASGTSGMKVLVNGGLNLAECPAHLANLAEIHLNGDRLLRRTEVCPQPRERLVTIQSDFDVVS